MSKVEYNIISKTKMEHCSYCEKEITEAEWIGCDGWCEDCQNDEVEYA